MKTLLKKLNELAKESNKINLTISLPTNRTFPDNQNDAVLLKNLINEAEKNIINRFGKRETVEILENLSKVNDVVKINYNLDSLHIYVSENTLEIFQLPLELENSEVIVSEKFDLHYIQDFLNNTEEYLILVLTQSGVKLYDAVNDSVISEIQNDDFPFEPNSHYITHSDKASDAKQIDNMVKEYFNKVDKVVQKVYNTSKLSIVVISTPRNYQHLLEVSDNPQVYKGNSAINYNNLSLHSIGEQAWELLLVKI